MSTSTRSPTLITPSVCSPGASTSIPTSRKNFTGGRLCLEKCPRIAFVSFFSFTNSTRPICADSYPSRVLVLCCVITHGPAFKTVAGRTSPFESKSCVMPTFLPRIPTTLAISFSVPSLARRKIHRLLLAEELSLFGLRGFSLCGDGAKPRHTRLFMLFPERLNLHIHARRQVE